MSEKKGHFDNNLDTAAFPRLAEDLKGLYGVGVSVPGEVDRAVLDRAGRRLTRRSRRLSWPRWARRWRVAGAAAAVVLLALVLQTNLSPLSDSGEKAPVLLSKAVSPEIPADIDLNGRVDILDAFKLARHIESETPFKPEYDLNADGVVNRKDVDSIAFAAVRLDKGA